ncbi:MAG: hypothetical protein ABIY70_26235 [Capsulimonas sp.]|uniref:hypothetical protein n=1 Tax=Capsulimonas sp. TaxID=2494211 RepID=UPI003264DBC4
MKHLASARASASFGKGFQAFFYDPDAGAGDPRRCRRWAMRTFCLLVFIAPIVFLRMHTHKPGTELAAIRILEMIPALAWASTYSEKAKSYFIVGLLFGYTIELPLEIAFHSSLHPHTLVSYLQWQADTLFPILLGAGLVLLRERAGRGRRQFSETH